MIQIQSNILEYDFDILQENVGKGFLDDKSKELLKKNISSEVKYLLIEDPYIDKDFRDTYYHDFSKRFFDISRNSIRVHLLKSQNLDQNKAENYLGFFTLRQTPPFNIGRSYIHPSAIRDSPSGFYCLSNISVQLFGYEYKIHAFPWMQQDANVSRCAHIAIWEIVRYFSDRHKNYHETTLNSISQLADAITRKIPSNGMTVAQIAQVMTKVGFSVDLYFRDKGDALFNRLIYIFIESGLPLVCALTTKAHAISIIGHGVPYLKQRRLIKQKTIIDSSELVESFISCDDNLLPYSVIGENGTARHRVKDIDVILVPLYEKMYISARHLLENVLPGLEDYLPIVPDRNKTLIRRILLTSSNAFKKFIQANSMDDTYKLFIARTLMPKFIWMIEYADSDTYPREISHRIILDSTALNHSALDNIIINCKFKDKLRFMIDDQVEWVSTDAVKDCLYVNNLMEIR